MKKCKSVNLLFFLHVNFAQITKECNQICILFLSNQSNSEVGNMTSKSDVVTIPYYFFSSEIGSTSVSNNYPIILA